MPQCVLLLAGPLLIAKARRTQPNLALVPEQSTEKRVDNSSSNVLPVGGSDHVLTSADFFAPAAVVVPGAGNVSNVTTINVTSVSEAADLARTTAENLNQSGRFVSTETGLNAVFGLGTSSGGCVRVIGSSSCAVMRRRIARLLVTVFGALRVAVHKRPRNQRLRVQRPLAQRLRIQRRRVQRR